MKEKTIVVNIENVQYHLKRLDDDRLYELRENSICIAFPILSYLLPVPGTARGSFKLG